MALCKKYGREITKYEDTVYKGLCSLCAEENPIQKEAMKENFGLIFELIIIIIGIVVVLVFFATYGVPEY